MCYNIWGSECGNKAMVVFPWWKGSEGGSIKMVEPCLFNMWDGLWVGDYMVDEKFGN